ncbi:MAG: GntR family transcriptional regulator [Chloroflexota bacterium]
MHSRTRPLYWQVADDIATKIASGEWPAGHKLPSERELCSVHGVSQITVRRALRELEHPKRVYSQHGVGWFVASEALVEEARCVALLVPALGWPMAELVRLLANELAERNVGLRVALTEGDSNQERRAMAQVVGNGADALLWVAAGPQPALRARYDALLAQTDLPQLMLWRSVPEIDLPSMVLDEQACMEQLTRHVLSLGHSRVAYAGTSPAQPDGRDRYWGFVSALWEHGLELPLDWVFAERLDGEPEAQRLRATFQGDRGPTALVCDSDLVAAEAMRVLCSAGLHCPQHVAIVGLGDRDFCPYLPTPLTTLRFDLEPLAHAAALAALDLMAGRHVASARFGGRMAVRESCGADVAGQGADLLRS